jgi:hypothetical protein
LLLLAAGSAGAALFLWGYISPRYLGDFVPFLVLASAVAIVDIWRRLEGRKRSIRIGALGAIAALALFTIAANIGMAITPNEEWLTGQVYNYVKTQKAVSDFTGVSLKAHVVRGSSLPGWGPADQLYVIGNCDGFYVSNGEYYSTVPEQQFQRKTWMVVERGHAFQHTFRITFRRPASGGTEMASLVTAGHTTVAVSVAPLSTPNWVLVQYHVLGQGPVHSGAQLGFVSGTSHQVVVVTDPANRTIEVRMGPRTPLRSTPLVNGEPVHDVAVASQSRGTSPAISVVDETPSTPEPTLCQSLIH